MWHVTIFMRLLKEKPRESNLTKIVISKCCGNLKSRIVGKEEKPVLKYKQMWEMCKIEPF